MAERCLVPIFGLVSLRPYINKSNIFAIWQCGVPVRLSRSAFGGTSASEAAPTARHSDTVVLGVCRVVKSPSKNRSATRLSGALK